MEPPAPRRYAVVAKAAFFVFISTFAFEAFLDVNPTRISVAGSGLSISYFVYLTLPDLLRFFPEGLAIMAVGAFLFALSKYRYLPLVLAAFALAFYLVVVQSKAMADYYISVYACHYEGAVYVCPLFSLVNGRPTIPLQGDVLGFAAFVLAAPSYAVYRLRLGLGVAVAEAMAVASGSLTVYEVAIFLWQRQWYDQRVTFYQKLLLLGGLTNQDVLYVAGTVLTGALLLRFYLGRRSLPARD